MYAKAMNAAGKSLTTIRGWINEYRIGNTSERTDNTAEERRRTSDIDQVRQRHPYIFEFSRSNSEPTGFSRADIPQISHDAERGRNCSLRTKDGTNVHGGTTEHIARQRTHISDIYIEEEILTSCREVAEVNRNDILGASSERFENCTSCHSITSIEISTNRGLIADRLFKPSISNSTTEEIIFRNRSQTLDAKARRPRQNARSARPIPRCRQHHGKENEEPMINTWSDGKLAPRERKVSICSITKITRAFLATEDGNDCASTNSSLFMEEVFMKSCEEKTIGVFKESFNEEEEKDDVKVPQEIMGQAKSTRGPITGRVKLCLQHFEASRVLRVIVLKATNLKAKKGCVYCKLSAQFIAPKSNKKKVMKLAKVKAGSEVCFNEQIYFDNIDEDDIDRLTLSIRLYNREGVFRSNRCLGEMVIPLFKYDLSMDTNIKGNLRQDRADLKNLRMFDDDGDLEVISEDRSIAACVAANLNKSAAPNSPRFKNMNNNPVYDSRQVSS